MARVSGAIPNLVNGISQQPPALRLPTQADEQVNCYSTAVNGLINRPPVEHIAKIIASIDTNAFVHIINRDVNERYVSIYTPNLVKVYNFAGVEQTVNIEKQTYTSINAVAAVSTGTGYRVYFANSNSTLEVITTGITTATVLVEESTTADFTSATTKATITTNTTTSVTAVSGRYYRCRISAWTSGTITAQLRWRDAGYLQCVDPSTEMRALTVADYTFVLNKTATVKKTSKISTNYGNQGLVFVKSGAYGRTYRILINDVEQAAIRTASGNEASDADEIDTVLIARCLESLLKGVNSSSFDQDNVAVTVAAGANGIETGGTYTVTRNQASLLITRNDATAWTLKTEDGQNGNAMSHVKDKTAKFSDLPLFGSTDFHCKIEGQQKKDVGDYYVICESNDKNVWKESVQESIQVEIDRMTMPHSLTRENDGTFTFKPIEWNERDVGDDDSNPFPSFVDKPINDMFFHKNRLGFLSDESVIMSAAGDFFRFFRTTATAILDDDPIDLSASHDKVSILVNSIPYQDNLLAFSDQTQFKLESDGLLTPTSVSLNPTTEFQASAQAKPVGVGTFVFFAVERAAFSSLQEFYVENDTLQNDAREITANVPEYVPSGIRLMAATSNESVIVAYSDVQPNRLYIYKFLYSDNEDQKIQSSWSYWEFPGVTKVHSFAYIQSQLYWVVTRADGVFLEKLNFEQGLSGDYNLGFRVHLDQKITTDNAAVSSTYNSETDRTTFTFPFTWKVVPTVVCASVKDDAVGFSVPIVGDPETYNSSSIIVEGDYRTEDVIFGIPYECFYTPSIFQVRQEADGGGVAVITEGRLQIQRCSVQYARTGYIEVLVEPVGREPWRYDPNSYVYAFNGRITGDETNTIGTPAIDTGKYSFPVMSKNDRVKITFKSNSYLPFQLISLEWVGQWHMKSKRI